MYYNSYLLPVFPRAALGARPGGLGRAPRGRPVCGICSSIYHTVGFHNFNLRNFNLRISNQSKLIVDVFLTRCRISMCQGLGPNKTR